MAPAVNGTVIDTKTRKPVEAVEVVRVPRVGESARVAMTGEDGSFHVDAFGGAVFSLPIGDPGYLGFYALRKEGYVDGRIDYGVINTLRRVRPS
jgi:hypothetical protein